MSKETVINWLLRLAWPICALALVVGLSWQGKGWLDGREKISQREQAVETASSQVIDLTTMDSATVQDKLESLAGRTVGDFKDQFNDITKSFQDVVEKNQITATGVIDGAAIESISDTQASVIVASSATITEKAKQEPVVRTYRLRIKLERSDDTWLVAGMEFVQ